MSPLAHVTEVDQEGGVGDDVTADHEGSPERLEYVRKGL
jgi:pantoate kinase